MSESAKFEFSISIDELKSCERLSLWIVIPSGEGSALLKDDAAHFRQVVYRLRQSFAGAHNEPGAPSAVTDSAAPGTGKIIPSASDPSL